MRYIKSFNESLDNNEIEFFDDIEDIILPIRDEDFYVQIFKNENSSVESMEGDGELARIYIEKQLNDIITEPYIPTQTFNNTLNQLLSYSKSNGYSCSMEIIGQSKNLAENDCIAYSEFGEDDMSVEELLDVKAPINYIRVIIYKPE